MEELQGLVARNQTIAQKHSREIAALEAELQRATSDKKLLEQRVRALSKRIRLATG